MPDSETGTPASASACQCSATDPVPIPLAASAVSGRTSWTASPARKSRTSWPSAAAVRATRNARAARLGFSGSVARLTNSGTSLLLVGHSGNVAPGELADHLRVVALDVRLDLADQLAFGLGPHDFATFAVDDHSHDQPPSSEQRKHCDAARLALPWQNIGDRQPHADTALRPIRRRAARSAARARAAGASGPAA